MLSFVVSLLTLAVDPAVLWVLVFLMACGTQAGVAWGNPMPVGFVGMCLILLIGKARSKPTVQVSTR
jgi:hypothetical protein